MKFVILVLLASVCSKRVKGFGWNDIWGGIQSVFQLNPVYHVVDAVGSIVQGGNVGSAITNGLNNWGNAISNVLPGPPGPAATIDDAEMEKRYRLIAETRDRLIYAVENYRAFLKSEEKALAILDPQERANMKIRAEIREDN
jgi:hypothetical protein